VWVYSPQEHKLAYQDEDRLIVIGPQARAIVEPYFEAWDASKPIFSPARSERIRLSQLHQQRNTPLHHGNRPGSNVSSCPLKRPGERYTTDSYRRAIQRACKKAGIKRWSPNRLRHAAGTQLRKQFGIEAASTILGHRTTKMTETYAQRNIEQGKRIARQVG
jgi:integrase